MRWHDQAAGVSAGRGEGRATTVPAVDGAATGPRRWRARLLSLCWIPLLLYTSGCGERVPQLAPLERNAVVIAFGDSLTWGTGAGSEESYPAVLARLTGLQVVNAGVPGEVTGEGLTRLPGLLERHRPALVILCHGGNDMLRRQSADSMYRNLEAMIDEARAHGAEVILVGVPQPRLLFLEPAEIYDRLANDRHLVYLRETLPELESESDMKSDPIHLNGKGYRRLAEAIHELMKSAGALPH